jgi:hypothetical protein
MTVNHTTSWSTSLLMACLAMTSCAPSLKNEEKHWGNNQKAAIEFKAAYPGFTTVIDAKLQAARVAFEAATKEADEAKKAEQMKAANALASEILNPLNEIKYKTESVKNTVEKLETLKLGKGDTRNDDAANTARNELSKVKTALAAAAPATVEDAIAALKPQVSALIAAKGAADRALAALGSSKGKK